MTNLSEATFKLTNGDLSGMDAGQLREHAVAYAAAHGTDDHDGYVSAVAQRIADQTGVKFEDVWNDIEEDAYGEYQDRMASEAEAAEVRRSETSRVVL